jgi:hypothetical protein
MWNENPWKNQIENILVPSEKKKPPLKETDIQTYSKNLKSKKEAIKKEEKKDKAKEWNPDIILKNIETVDKNKDFIELYEEFEKLNAQIRKDIEYCIEYWTLQSFEYPFYNEKKEDKDYISFKVCGDAKTIEFWNKEKWKIWIMEQTNDAPETWSITCTNRLDLSSKNLNEFIKWKCFKTLEECIKPCIDLCVK